MENEDIESTYTLFSPRAQRQVPVSKLQEILEGKNYSLFEGYQGLSLTNLKISAVTHPNPDLPQGTVAEVAGVITYEGGIEGSVSGVLEKIGDQWMISGINITVPPSKIK